MIQFSGETIVSAARSVFVRLITINASAIAHRAAVAGRVVAHANAPATARSERRP